MTREESIKWIDEEIRWENECQSKHPIKEALYEARKALEQKTCKYVVSRAEVKKIAKEMYLEVANMELDAKTISDCISCTASKCREVLERKLQAIPPVTPQEPNTWSLDDAREDFMHDVYNELDFLPTNEEANCIIDIFDRVTSSIEQEPILDKIRERVERMQKMCDKDDLNLQAQYSAFGMVLDIIDKYKAESEG